ncbi:MAG: type II toxin-antitoxin system VapC family toxin [Tepidisphaeraceae bacterium]
MFKVYLETSFFSECCTIRTGDIARGRRATSLDWWRHFARGFDLYVSAEVVRELSSVDFPRAVREPALAMLRGLTLLPTTPEVVSFAELLVAEQVMPEPANEGDALHLAVSVVHHMDYLLTWNQKHLANPNKRTHLTIVAARARLQLPELVTPDLMRLE